jgi:hypothetical protein
MGFPSAKREQWVQDAIEDSSVTPEIENTRTRMKNFEIVSRAFTGFCDYLPQTHQEDRWTFDNLIGILRGGEPSSGRLRFELTLLKNASNKILMHYLNTSEVRSSEQYSNADVNLYKDVMMKAFTMADLSTDTRPISWFAGVTRQPSNVIYYDSISERIQQVFEKPWKEIQQTYFKILSELRRMSVTHLENLSQIPSRVLYFCYQQQILGYLAIATEIIEKSFLTTISEIGMEPEIDSETGEEWLEFKIRIKGEVEEVLDRYDKYTERLVSLLPGSARYKMRLSYNII